MRPVFPTEGCEDTGLGSVMAWHAQGMAWQPRVCRGWMTNGKRKAGPGSYSALNAKLKSLKFCTAVNQVPLLALAVAIKSSHLLSAY